MSAEDTEIEGLREALGVTPENVPLRRLLAERLAARGRYDEAEREFRATLTMAPKDVAAELGLANVYFQQRKMSHALVIIEELMRRADTPARAYLLHARLLYHQGDAERAARQYRRAIESDASAADAALAAALGIGPADRNDENESEFVDGRERLRDGGPEELRDASIERPTISFNDVGGMEALKEEIRLKIIYPLEHPEVYRAYGKSVGGGILLYGPPGCGKTHLARATAGEVKASFIAVGINDVMEMWIGQSERNLHELFETARRNRPCVLFFDEVDALGASRSDMRASAGRQVINQFLSELDGVKSSNEGVLILAATNAPWHLDSAFRRPGRFDRVLFVPPPDLAARAAIAQVLLRGKPMKDLDAELVAKKTDGFSGADLMAVVNRAIEGKLNEAIQRGAPTPLTTSDLLTSARGLRATTKEWFSTARNYAMYSNEAGVYDDILTYLKMK